MAVRADCRLQMMKTRLDGATVLPGLTCFWVATDVMVGIHWVKSRPPREKNEATKKPAKSFRVKLHTVKHRKHNKARSMPIGTRLTGRTSLLFVHAIMKVKKGGCQRDPYIGGVSSASVVYDGVVLVYCLPPMLCGWPRPIGGRPCA